MSCYLFDFWAVFKLFKFFFVWAEGFVCWKWAEKAYEGKNCFVNLRDEMPLSPPFKEMFSKANICHRSSVKQQLSFQNKKNWTIDFFSLLWDGFDKKGKNFLDKNIRLPKICPVLSSFTLYLKTAATAQLNTKA